MSRRELVPPTRNGFVWSSVNFGVVFSFSWSMRELCVDAVSILSSSQSSMASSSS